MVNARSGLKLVTFDLDPESYLHTSLAHAIPFEWLYLSTSFWYIFRTSTSRFSSRSWVGSAEAVAYNSKTAGRILLWLDQNLCYDNARSNLEHLTLRHIFIFFKFKL